MAIFIPTILESDATLVQEEATELSHWVKRISLDIADNSLVSNRTALPSSIGRLIDGLAVDVHLMVNRPGKYLKEIAQLGWQQVIIHLEIEESIDELYATCLDLGLELALTLNPDTPVDRLRAYGHLASYIQVMAIQPGFGGQAFIESSYDRIKAVKRLFPETPIAVDGGVRLENAPTLIAAGAEILMVGRGGYADQAGSYQLIDDWQKLVH